jgi:hypothetical protein
MKIFLGGTIDSVWRKEFISFLEDEHIDYYNPVITGRSWNLDDALEEERQKTICDQILFVITPNMKGFYSIWEMAAIAHLVPSKLVICFTKEDRELTIVDDWDVYLRNTWNDQQIRSIVEISNRCQELNIPFYKDIFSLHQHYRLLKEKQSQLESKDEDINTGFVPEENKIP